MSSLITRLALFGAMMVALAAPAFAMGSEPPPEKDAATPCKDPAKCPPGAKEKSKPAQADCKSADKSKCKPKQSFNEQYRDAVALVDAGRYPEALDAMHALDDGTSADVITYIGFINRKLGRMAEAQMYYEAALHMKPNHRGALEYYGEWYCMMGNLEKARENLALIKTIYGADTKEYLALAKMIDETIAQKKS
jgi:predicted Zn-dependent protease